MLIAILIVSLALVAAGLLWVRNDYRAWLALGKGGLPANLAGWIRTTGFRLRKAPTMSTTPYDALIGEAGDVDLLGGLTPRSGPRPTFAPWPVPHRQTDQFISAEMRGALEGVFEAAVEKRPDALGFELSHYEKRNRAITSRHPEKGPAVAALSHGEIAHTHPADGSIHLILSPTDARTAIDAGWAERHPMSGVLAELPVVYLAVYPPRDREELKVVESLLDASVRYMVGSK